MNCTNLLENLGFTCAPRNNGALRLWSPFTFDDGEHLGLFLEPLGGDQWLITDHADTLMHASAMGAKLTKPRLERIRSRFPSVELTEGGALRATATQSELSMTVTAVLNTAIAISHAEPGWLPKTNEERFIQLVGREDALGNDMVGLVVEITMDDGEDMVVLCARLVCVNNAIKKVVQRK